MKNANSGKLKVFLKIVATDRDTWNIERLAGRQNVGSNESNTRGYIARMITSKKKGIPLLTDNTRQGA
jgi:hypothetical protein